MNAEVSGHDLNTFRAEIGGDQPYEVLPTRLENFNHFKHSKEKDMQPKAKQKGIGNRSRLLLISLVALTLAACGQQAQPEIEGASTVAPLYNQNNAGRLPGQYIVVLKSGVEARAGASVLGQFPQAAVRDTYDMPGFQGFAVTATDQQIAELRNSASVAYVEANARVAAYQTSTNVWGLDRIDQRSLPLDGMYNSGGRTGSSVRAYVIDTGIRATHAEFGGRVGSGYSAINDGRGTNDCEGHGTHVAGTIGGKTYGVAKQVKLFPVRVLDCEGSGTYSGVIAGVNWVTNNAVLPSVANMSLGGPASQSLDDAIKASIAKGITYVVAAGNSSADACNDSPARVPGAITVGATDPSDYAPYWSNYGSCIDLFAPGENVKSASNTGDTATATKSGTSMASPHVAGVVALLGAPTNSSSLINSCSTKGIVQEAYSEHNDLLYTCATTTYNYTLDYSSLTSGRVISAVRKGSGITTTGPVTSSVSVQGLRKGKTGNVAMVQGTNKSLILSKDGVSQTPYSTGGTMTFGFTSFGTGKVTVKTIKLSSTNTTGGTVKVYNGSTLLKTVPVPKLGSGVSRTLTISTMNANKVIMTLTGVGKVDDLIVSQ